MAAFLRPRAWIAAAVIIFFLLLLPGHRDGLSTHYQGGGSPKQTPAAFSEAEKEHITPPPTGNGNDKDGGGADTKVPVRPPPGGSAQLVEDAHKLPFADAFWSHFEAVMQQHQISLADAKRACNWGPTDKVNFQFAHDVDWAVHDRPDDEIESRRKEWHEYLRDGTIRYSQVADRFSGRGVVIVAGNQDTIERVKVILRALHKVSSKVAIEIHYWGAEMDGQSRLALSNSWPNIFFNDLSGSHNIVKVKKDGLYINYQLKPAALLNSRFAEPLLLDSDNIPLLDPATLFDSATYREYGTVFWPDIARTRPQNPAWAISNTPCRMDEFEQESGQLLVDKTRFWYHLQLAAWWINEHGAYFKDFILGDKDMFRFAWHALRTRYGKPRKWLTSVGTLNEDVYCGHSFAQHHPDDGRVAFLHGGLVKTVSLEVMRWNREVKGGYYRHYKRAPSDEDPGVSINVGIKWDGAEYMPNHTAEFHAAMCTDFYEVSARDINEIIPLWEKNSEEIGGYWQLDGDKSKGKGAETGKAAVATGTGAPYAP